MASLADILTTAKNIVTAINNATQTYLNINGAANFTNLTSATVVKASAGRVCTVVVVATGATTGKIYDATSASSTSNPIYTIPASVGFSVLNIPVSYGIVVAPGSGQTISGSYS